MIWLFEKGNFIMTYSSLIIDTFLILRDAFFDATMQPIPFTLRDKRNTQDDPLDEYIGQLLQERLSGAVCQTSPGPLINPDLVIYRPELCQGQSHALLADNVTRIVGIEVKKLERGAGGRIARVSGMDYNTTPPCGNILVYAADGAELKIRGFYLFVAQETMPDRQVVLTALALCDGNILNEDFDLYLSIVCQRQKTVGLGSYGDGVNRNRPMLIFANPLGAQELDRTATVVVPEAQDDRVRLVYRIVRRTPAGAARDFYAYRKSTDIPADWEMRTLHEPFPQPSARVSETQARGRFRVPFVVES